MVPPRRHARYRAIKKGDTMRRQLTAVMSFAFVAASGAVTAHHSFAMFDQENPIELEGVVQEFKYTSPHSYILLEVKGEDGNTAVWNLEGPAPSLLSRDGWSSQTLKSKDEVIMTIDPLRSGAPGGSWQSRKIKFRNGQPMRTRPLVGKVPIPPIFASPTACP